MMKKTISLVCTTLASLAFLAGMAAAQATTDHSAAGVPTSNPEPMTWAALLGGAALAGGIAYRLRKKAR